MLLDLIFVVGALKLTVVPRKFVVAALRFEVVPVIVVVAALRLVVVPVPPMFVVVEFKLVVVPETDVVEALRLVVVPVTVVVADFKLVVVLVPPILVVVEFKLAVVPATVVVAALMLSCACAEKNAASPIVATEIEILLFILCLFLIFCSRQCAAVRRLLSVISNSRGLARSLQASAQVDYWNALKWHRHG